MTTTNNHPYIAYKFPNEDHVDLIPNESIAVSRIGDIIYKDNGGNIINTTADIKESVGSKTINYAIYEVEATTANQSNFIIPFKAGETFDSSADSVIVIQNSINDDGHAGVITHQVSGTSLILSSGVSVGTKFTLLVFKLFQISTVNRVIKFNIDANYLTSDKIIETASKRFTSNNEIGGLATRNYVDSNLASLTANGVPKLSTYSFVVTAIEENQTVFDIPLPTYDPVTDTLILNVGGESHLGFENESYIVSAETNSVTIANPVPIGTHIGILIIKNVAMGPDGGIAGDVIASNTMSLDRIKNSLGKRLVTIAEMNYLQSVSAESESLKEELDVLKLELLEKDVINEMARTRYGYYDVFKDLDGVNSIKTNAELSHVNKAIRFPDKVIDVLCNNAGVDSSHIETTKDKYDIINIGDKINNSIEITNKTQGSLTGATTVDLTLTEKHIAENLDIANSSLVSGKKIARDSLGNFYTVYYAKKNGINQIICRVSKDHGKTWTDMAFPEIIGYAQSNPAITIDSADNIHIVWRGKDGTNDVAQIKYSKFDSTSKVWSIYVNIQPITGYVQYFPTIDVDSKDNVYVIWQGCDGSNPLSAQIKYSKFNKSLKTWTPWINLHQAPDLPQLAPSMVIDSQDNVHLVWYGRDSLNVETQIKYSKLDKISSKWSPVINIKTIPGRKQQYPVVDVDSLDNPHVIWQGTDSENTDKLQIKYSFLNSSTGVWSNWVNIQRISGHNQMYPSISIDVNNNIHVTWAGTDTNNLLKNQIKYTKLTNVDGTWSPWINIKPVATHEQSQATIYTKNLVSIEKPLIIFGNYSQTKMSIYGKYNNTGNIYNLVLATPMTIKAGDVVEVYKNDFELFMKNQMFDTYSKIKLNLYPDIIPRLRIIGNHTDTDTIQVKNVDNRRVVVGDSLRIGNEVVPILGATKASATVIKEMDLISDPHSIITNSEVNLSGSSKIKTDNKGDMYVTFTTVINGFAQCACLCSTDDGITWTNLNPPLITGYTQNYATIEIDAYDNIYLFWSGCNEVHTYFDQLMYSRYDRLTETWSNPAIPFAFPDHKQGVPSTYMDIERDILHLVWEGMDPIVGNSFQIKHATLDITTNTWSVWQNVTEITGVGDEIYQQYAASIACDSNNRLHVVWNGTDPENDTFQIKYAYKDLGSETWSTWTNIAVVTGLDQWYPIIKVDSNDNLHVVWSGKDLLPMEGIQLPKYTKMDASTLTWSDYVIINDFYGYGSELSADFDIEGNLHVACHGLNYMTHDGGNFQILHTKLNVVTGEWTPFKYASPIFDTYQGNAFIYAKTMKDVELPLILFSNNDGLSLDIAGKFTNIITDTLDTVVLNKPISLQGGDTCILVEFKVYNNGDELTLTRVLENTMIYEAIQNPNIATSIKVTSSDSTLKALSYSLK